MFCRELQTASPAPANENGIWFTVMPSTWDRSYRHETLRCVRTKGSFVFKRRLTQRMCTLRVLFRDISLDSILNPLYEISGAEEGVGGGGGAGLLRTLIKIFKKRKRRKKQNNNNNNNKKHLINFVKSANKGDNWRSKDVIPTQQ